MLNMREGDRRQLIHTSPCSNGVHGGASIGQSLVSPETSSKEAVIANLLDDNDIMPEGYHERHKHLQHDSHNEEGSPYVPEIVQHHENPEETHHGVIGDLPPIHHNPDLSHDNHHEDHHVSHDNSHQHGEHVDETVSPAEKGKLLKLFT